MANPLTLKAYEHNRTLGQARIDWILAIYDGVLAQLDRARTLLNQGDEAAAGPVLAKAKIGIGTLATGVELAGGELPAIFHRLYEFVLHCLDNPIRIEDALKVLLPLHDAFKTIRMEALILERNGTIPSLEQMQVIQTSA